MDLFFQDPASTRNPSQSQLFGRVSLLQVLRKRVDALGADEGGGDLSPEPFALESALATLALSILKRSSGSKQKEFADQLVRQLSCLGEVLSSGDSSAPKSIRRVNSGGAIGWGRTLSIRANEIDAVPGPPAAVQVAVWMRLQVLLPLLPVVYSDREPDPKKNLRDVLSVALVQLLGSPAARADPWLGSQDPSASAATAAATAAGDSLFSRLLAVLHGLLGGQWATWLSRYSKDKLRDVPPFENTAQLSQAVSGVRLPPHLAHRLLSSLPLPSAPSLSIPSAAPPPRPFSIPGSGLAPPQRERSDGPAPGEPSAAPHMTTAPHQQGTVMDPWQLLETAASGNPRRDPHWLAGAQRVRRRALTYAVDMDLQADATALIATKQSPCSGQQQSQQSLESRVEGAPVAQERCP